jgi:hypothetical protein
LRTKIRPLVLPADADDGAIDLALTEFRNGYAAYYDRCKHSDSPAMRNPNPSVVLVPSVGMISFNKNAKEARVTGEFYRNAIEVMRGAETISRYTALPEQEAFNIEYWLLEEAKLKRQPPEKEMARKIALVIGAGPGIGLNVCERLLAQDARLQVFRGGESRTAEGAMLNRNNERGRISTYLDIFIVKLLSNKLIPNVVVRHKRAGECRKARS